MALRFFLRETTRELHASLDSEMSALDLSRFHDYCDFLVIQAGALPALERALEDGDVGSTFPEWGAHCRTEALGRDLAGCGLPMIDAVPISAVREPARQMGVLYVLEGSRLGGRLLEKQAARQPAARKSFLLHGAGKPLWPNFVQRLEAMGDDRETRSGLLDGARLAFETYWVSARRVLTQREAVKAPHLEVRSAS